MRFSTASPHCGPLTASKASLVRVETPPLSLAIAGRLPGTSAAALIARHVGLLHDAGEGASRVLKPNEVVFSTIPPGISSRSQSDQSLNFGLFVRCRGRDEANSGCGDAFRDPGTRD